MTDDPGDARGRLEAIHDHLAATAELPVDRRVTAYLGEADAVAADAVAAHRDGQDAAARRRLDQVVALLSHVEATGHPGADDHVAAARSLASAYLEDREE